LFRDFTCISTSLNATLLFVPFDEVYSLLKNCNFSLIQKLFDERKTVIDASLIEIGVLSSKVAGTGLISFDEYRANEETLENVKR